jgi:hypothetical protein
MKRLMGVMCAVLAVRAGADTLGDVRNAVKRLTAKVPVRATYGSESSMNAEGRFANQKSARAVTAEVVHDASGVSITVPQSLIEKDDQDDVGSLNALTIIETIDFRRPLLDLIENAAVTSESRVMLHGKPARLLALKLRPKPRREGGSISVGKVESDDQMKLWIGDDNVPLAAERVQNTTAGFMFIKAKHTGRTSYTFAHTADRLILARLESNDTGSGMGQSVNANGVRTLTLH